MILPSTNTLAYFVSPASDEAKKVLQLGLLTQLTFFIPIFGANNNFKSAPFFK